MTKVLSDVSMAGYVDSHCHLADPRFDSSLTEVLIQSKRVGVTIWVQGGVGPEDWSCQREIQKFEPGIKMVVGLHPYWVAQHSEIECEAALDLLARSTNGAVAIGETGLDFRPAYESARDLQIDMFRSQLELSQAIGKPVVLHLVQAVEESLRVLDFVGIPNAGAMVHSFNGNSEVAKQYLERGLMLSIGGPLLRPKNERLKTAVCAIPLEKMLLESDAPDQAPDFQLRSEPSLIIKVANEIALLKRLSKEEVLQTCSRNAQIFFGL